MFSENLRLLREDKNLFQKDVAKVLGFSDITISHYERGYSEPNLDTLMVLAAFFEVTVGQLLGSEELFWLKHKKDT